MTNDRGVGLDSDQLRAGEMLLSDTILFARGVSVTPVDIDSKDPNSNSSNWLAKYASNTFSQFGEDGIIEKIFSLLPDVSKWCVEFGAWDGKHFSNTHLLLSHEGWSGVLIEADPYRFKELCQTYNDNKRVTCLNKMVSFDGENILDNILSHTSIPEDFDLLSIDIDGNDFHVWESLVDFRPKVVIIEFNNTIPNRIEFVQEANYSVNQGCSLLSLYKLARNKGYELVAVTDFNAFFVDAAYFPLFEIVDNSPDAMNNNQKYITHVFQLYDGTIVWKGNLRLLWRSLEINPERHQILPKFIRYFPEKKTSWFRRLVFSCYKRLRL
jgi:hypothetical protein